MPVFDCIGPTQALCWLAGALLAVGILNCGVQHENDPAYALLYDFVEKEDPVVRIGAIMGLGLAYAGTQKEEVRWNMQFSSRFFFHDCIPSCRCNMAAGHVHLAVHVCMCIRHGDAAAVECDEQVGDLLAPIVTDPDISIEVASFAAVALGLVFVATCHASSVEAILQVHRAHLHLSYEC
jgi:hypothetical protein